MRPFLYPLMVALSLIGLVVVVSNFASFEQREVCSLCGRVQVTHRADVFGSDIERTKETLDTEFSRRVPWASECRTHLWLVYLNHRTRGFFGTRTTDIQAPAVLVRLLDDPTPVLRLADVDPKRARAVIKDLVSARPVQSTSVVYNAQGMRVLRRTPLQSAPDALTELLQELWKKPMTRKEYENLGKEEDDPDPQGPH